LSKSRAAALTFAVPLAVLLAPAVVIVERGAWPALDPAA
jgi:hypothetical protein